MADGQKVYEIPIGPIHPALKEPIRFTFQVEGERIRGSRSGLGLPTGGSSSWASSGT